MRSIDVLLLGTGLALGACSASAKDGNGGGPGPSGDLQVEVTGLPAGTAGRVTVTGPNSYLRNLTGTTQLSGLSAGVYRVAAGHVNAQGQTWTAAPSPDSAVVSIDDTAAVSVAYSGGPATSLNLRVAGTQLIQSTQRDDGGVPMIAGRDALLRVFVIADGANSARPVVRVRVLNGGVPVDSVDVPAVPAQTPLSIDTASLSQSWNALIPGVRVAAGLGLQVTLDPDDMVAETDEGDNRWPAGGGVSAVAVQTVPTLDLRFVPVTQSANNLTGRVDNANRENMAAVTRRVFPLGTMSVDVRSPFTTAAPVLDSNDDNNAWGQILNETSALQAADGSDRHYVSIVQVTYGGGIAGLGWIGAPASVSWDKPSSAPAVIAHEVGHNFGLLHAPCGNPSNPDPAFPYPGGGIGTWGLDLPARVIKSPAAYRDLMSYCSPEWISDYNYLDVLASRGSGPAVPSARTASQGLVVWGRIGAGRIVLEPAFGVQAPARLPARPGPDRLTGLDGAGNAVFSLSFEATEVPDLPRGSERQFAFVVPVAGAELERLSTLRLVGSGLTVYRSAATAGTAGPPAVRAEPAATGTRLRWDPAYPMAVVRDARSGEIVALARGGAAPLPRVRGALRVELSDGIRSRREAVTLRPAP